MIPTNLGGVSVRYLEVQDHAAYIALEKDAEVKRYVGGPSTRTEQDLLINLRLYRPCISLLVVADSETNAFIGRCGLLEEKGSSEVELYILLAKTHHRKGIAKVVVPFLVRLASANGKTAVAYVDPHNQSSLKLMERIGAFPAGTNTGDGYQAGHKCYVFTERSGR